MNTATVNEIYNRNTGSQIAYKRAYCDTVQYTEGIMDFQRTLNAFWFVDNIISYMPTVIQTFRQSTDPFYIIKMKVEEDKSGYIEIYREGYVNNKYSEHIQVIKQKIPYINLPTYEYKFYLALSFREPIIFTLLLTSEY